MNAPCPYIKYWPEDVLFEPKHVASCVLMTISVLCLTEYITLSYCITQLDGCHQNRIVIDKTIHVQTNKTNHKVRHPRCVKNKLE